VGKEMFFAKGGLRVVSLIVFGALRYDFCCWLL